MTGVQTCALPISYTHIHTHSHRQRESEREGNGHTHTRTHTHTQREICTHAFTNTSNNTQASLARPHLWPTNENSAQNRSFAGEGSTVRVIRETRRRAERDWKNQEDVKDHGMQGHRPPIK